RQLTGIWDISARLLTRMARFQGNLAASSGRDRGTPGPGARQENSCDASTDQVRREGTGGHRQRAVARLPGAELDQAQSLLHSEGVRQAAEHVVAEDQAPARVAARDRLALPDLRA